MLASNTHHQPRSRSARIGLRATAEQEVIIRRAAEVSRKSLTEFVLESVCAAAEETLLDQRLFLVDEEHWRAFQEVLERPAELKPRLRELLHSPSPWES
jgi:uncharacterized protein (DUF1778 family)